MRTFPANFATAIAKKGLTPITLVRIDIEAFRTNPAIILRLAQSSDSGGAGSFSTGSLSWKNLIIGASDIVQQVDANSGFINSDAKLDIEVVNVKTDLFTPDKRFSSIFRDYKAEGSLVRVYQWFAGESLDESDITNDALLMFKGELSGPDDYSEDTCRFQIVQLSAGYGRRVLGRNINSTDYQNAPEESIGRFLPIPFGVCPGIPAIPIHKAKETRLTIVLLDDDTVANVLDTTGFPESGTFIIDDQEIAYTGLTSKTFTGVSGQVNHHYRGSIVAEKLTDYPFVLFDKNHPCESIGNVYADGHLVDSGDVTKDLANGEVSFTKRPQFNDKQDSQFLNVHFDAADATNNATNPLKAIDPENKTDGAEINQTTPILAVKQTDTIAARGEISRALVQVVHFEEEKLPNDTLTVEIVGAGEIGSLSKPATVDAVSLSGNPDFDSPVIENLDYPINPSGGGAGHAHTTAGSPSTENQNDATTASPPFTRVTTLPKFTTSKSETITLNFPALVGTGPTGYTYTLNLSGSMSYGINSPLRMQAWLEGVLIYDELNNAAPTVNLTSLAKSGTPSSSVDITVSYTYPLEGSFSGSGTFNINSQITRTVDLAGSTTTDSQLDALDTEKEGSISNVTGSVDLAAAGVAEKSSNVVTDEFDITSIIAGNWANLTNKVLQVKYNGTTDGRTAYIVLVRFIIEYAFSQIKYAESITADVNGVIDDVSGTVTGTPSLLIERPDHVFRWSLEKGLALPSITDDSNFAIAGTALAGAIAGGYKFAGMISEKKEIREWWAMWGKESRCILHFERGLARLFYRPLNIFDAATALDRKLTVADIVVQRSSQGDVSTFKLDRSRVDDVVNSINLKFNKNLRTGDYEAEVIDIDADSIARYGVREKADDFAFDWVRSTIMASDVCDFYLAELKEPAQYGTFRAKLEHIDLERFDMIGVQHPILDESGHAITFPAILVGPSRRIGTGQKKTEDVPLPTIRFYNAGFAPLTSGFGSQPFGSSPFGGAVTI